MKFFSGKLVNFDALLTNAKAVYNLPLDPIDAPDWPLVVGLI